MIRLNRFVKMPESWNHAIRWHMGAYDISQMDKYALEKAVAKYKEVLFLQTADMQAGLVDLRKPSLLTHRISRIQSLPFTSHKA
jgi:hypothetical protein